MRTKGSKNKHSFQVEELAQKFDVEPFEILMQIATGNWKFFGFSGPTKTTFTPQGIEVEELNIRMQERCQAAKDACKYLYSQKQAIAHSGQIDGFKIVVEDYSSKDKK